MPDASPHTARFGRVALALEVEIRSADGRHRPIGSVTHTVNVSECGLLMILPDHLDAVVGQEVEVSLRWDEGTAEIAGEIVRFESPYWGDGRSTVMGVRLRQPLPPQLLRECGRSARAGPPV